MRISLGYVKGVTHDDVRHRTASLFAALVLIVDNYATKKQAVFMRRNS
jgi:hypothetical protein